MHPGCKNSNAIKYKRKGRLQFFRDALCLWECLGEKFWRRYLDYVSVCCVRVAVRYISRHRAVGLMGYFHFVKKPGENERNEERLPQRESLREVD